MKIIIIDDEQASQEALKIKLAQVAPHSKIIKTFNSAVEALFEIEKYDADMVFLDVEMPEIDGISFLEKLQSRDFEVIITTAHAEYAIKAVRKAAFDFLLKPIDIEELQSTIDRWKDKVDLKLKPNKTQFSVTKQFDKLPIPVLRGLNFVPIHQILYLSSEGNYTTIYLEKKLKLVSSKNLGDYEETLENYGFFRIHHSTLINLNHINQYLKGDGGSVILSDDTELDVSKRRKKEFLELIGFK